MRCTICGRVNEYGNHKKCENKLTLLFCESCCRFEKRDHVHFRGTNSTICVLCHQPFKNKKYNNIAHKKCTKELEKELKSLQREKMMALHRSILIGYRQRRKLYNLLIKSV